MTPKKVLFITYYWPPSGGSGVQRPLKFIKYLTEFGWEPIVYTVENGEYPILDFSLEKDIPSNIEIIKRKIWEPYHLYKIFTGKSKKTKIDTNIIQKGKVSFTKKISLWIRANLFIPDPRIFWVKPSIRFLKKYIKENKIDAIITTGPPHSMHLIGYGLKKKTPIPWIADFRDPWTSIYYFNEFPLSTRSKRKQHQLEQKVLREADKIIVVGKSMKEEFQHSISSEKITIISNGYDQADFEKLNSSISSSSFTIFYAGLLTYLQNHSIFWEVIKELINTDSSFKKDIQIKLYGKIEASVIESISQFNLSEYVSVFSYVPHQELIELESQASVFLLLIPRYDQAKTIITGKLFEYIALRKPIISIGPIDGDAAHIIEEVSAGVTIDFEDKEKLKKAILHFYSLFKEKIPFSYSPKAELYTRKNLTKKLAEELTTISKVNLK